MNVSELESMSIMQLANVIHNGNADDLFNAVAIIDGRIQDANNNTAKNPRFEIFKAAYNIVQYAAHENYVPIADFFSMIGSVINDGAYNQDGGALNYLELLEKFRETLTCLMAEAEAMRCFQ